MAIVWTVTYGINVVITLVILIAALGIPATLIAFYIEEYGGYLAMAIIMLLVQVLWVAGIHPESVPEVAPLAAYSSYIHDLCLVAFAGLVVLGWRQAEMAERQRKAMGIMGGSMLIALLIWWLVIPLCNGFLYLYPLQVLS